MSVTGFIEGINGVWNMLQSGLLTMILVCFLGRVWEVYDLGLHSLHMLAYQSLSQMLGIFIRYWYWFFCQSNECMTNLSYFLPRDAKNS